MMPAANPPTARADGSNPGLESRTGSRPSEGTRIETRYDIVGCGAVVEELHAPILRVLRERSDLLIAGCYDLDARRAREVARLVGAERWGDRVAPSADDGVDGALIATPPGAHFEPALRYVEAGKGVFVEKPLACTSAEARSLLAGASSRGVPVMANQFWRYYPSLTTARHFLGARLDAVTSVEASEGFRWDWPVSSRYVVEDPHGGVIHDTGAHLLDAVLFVLGLDGAPGEASVEVRTVAKVPKEEPCHECVARMALTTDRAQPVEIRLQMSRLRPLARGIKVHGQFGTLFVPPGPAPAPILYRAGHGVRLRELEPELEPLDAAGCFLLAHEDFMYGLRDLSASTRIDGARFVLLIEVLESLRGEPGA
jgi:predicted dehydrogenase